MSWNDTDDAHFERLWRDGLSAALIGQRVVATSQAARAAELAQVPEPPAPVSIFKPRKASSCCWPLWGDRERPTHRYCEAEIKGGRLYCPRHERKAYVQRSVKDAA